MRKWLNNHKFSLLTCFIGIIMLPITYEDFIVECSSSYECCVYCFISLIGITTIGALFDYVSIKECEK